MESSSNHNDAWHFLTLLLDASNFSAVITDANAPDNPIVYVNAAFEKMTGYAINEVIGKNCRLLQNDDRDQPDRKLISMSIEKNAPCEHLLRNYRKDGQMFWNKLYLFPFRNDGQVIYFVGAQLDVTSEISMLATVKNTASERTRLIETLHTERNRIKRLSLKLLNAQEAERKALARELHDEFGQRLCGIKMFLDRAQSDMDADEKNLLVLQAKDEVSELIALVRNMSASLRPAKLEFFGLEATIYELLMRLFKDGPNWVFEYTDLPERLPLEIEITLFRIVQESVTNILRHANAGQVIVEMKRGPANEEITLTIADNGVGFDASRWKEVGASTARMGLIGMSERIELLGGTFVVKSAPNAGTCIAAVLRVICESD
ncbi:sensor histidine kinase [Massilia litorea]|uniref:histidine kinase n=1 Tax=Massilia litorea TaxID=2769491 RepID=A0A7L9UDP5_9BURK|nr:sensor histidine kinase [Massilia litorea]QOL52285.1 PAS domain-containing protein [Massilia litorea]